MLDVVKRLYCEWSSASLTWCDPKLPCRVSKWNEPIIRRYVQFSQCQLWHVSTHQYHTTMGHLLLYTSRKVNKSTIYMIWKYFAVKLGWPYRYRLIIEWWYMHAGAQVLVDPWMVDHGVSPYRDIRWTTITTKTWDVPPHVPQFLDIAIFI